MAHRETEEFIDPDERTFATHYHATGARFVVIAPPLFEEGARTRKVMVNLARALAEAGVDVVRFDYRGTGLSAGTTDELTLDAAGAALASAVDHARRRGAAQVDLIGFRFGAYLAAVRGAALGVERVVLWEPVVDLAAYFQDLLRTEVSNQVVTFGEVRVNRDALVRELAAGRDVVLDGNRVAAALYREIQAAPRLELAALAQRAHDLQLILWDNRKLHDAAQRAGVRSVLLADVALSWRNIRRLDPRCAALVDATVRAVKEAS